jgi:hypothetical protein
MSCGDVARSASKWECQGDSHSAKRSAQSGQVHPHPCGKQYDLAGSHGPNLGRRALWPILKKAAFWDESVLVALCVEQSFTPKSVSFESKYKMAVWWATHVEVASALAQLLRQKKISAAEWAHANRQAEGLANLWRVVVPTHKIETAPAHTHGCHAS